MAMALKETYYISHGAPTMCIDESFEANAFLKSWTKTVMGERPSSILMVSAHWDTIHPTVTLFSGRCPTIYDYGGYSFPDETYKLKYPAPGAQDLGRKVKELLMGSGFQRVDEDSERGLDHGAWGPLLLMYPEADIPVCQLSVQSDNDASYHYNMGKALAPLKDQGVLIIGSGTTVHNLNSTSLAPRPPLPAWAAEFDTWLKDALLQGRYDDVVHYLDKAPCPEMAHPTPEHFYPLHVAVGAAGDDAKAKLIHHSWGFGSISYASYGFSTPTTT